MNNSRKLNSVIAIFLLVVTLFTFGGCDIILEYLGLGNVLTIEATYEGDPIEVDGTLDKNDISVEATFVDGIMGHESTYEVFNFDVSPIDTSSVGDKTLLVTYTESGITATCTVIVPVVKKAMPTSISATYSGGEIGVGGTLDITDFSVVVTYDNNTTKQTDGFNVGSIDTSTAGDKMVTVTYVYMDGSEMKTLQTTVKVTVVPPSITIERISASYVGNPIQVGATLTNADFLVQEVYSDNSKVTVTNFTFGAVDTSTAGTKQVTISYQKYDVTYTTTINVTVVEVEVTLASISATFNNAHFHVGDTLVTADFTVVATYSDGHTSQVTNFAITGETTFATSGSKTTQLSYVYEGVTKTCAVTVEVLPAPVTLASISAIANNTSLQVGDELQPTDFIVTAHFSDDSQLVVSDFTFVSPTGELTQSGEIEVELSYTFNGVTKSVTLTVAVLDEEVANYGKYGRLSADGKSVKIVQTAKVVDTTDLQIHFLELGNQYTGDCTYIKAGDVDILIDAGSRQGSAKTIGDYIDQYCTDGVLEYVIATHAHRDHIAGFVGTTTKGEEGIFKRYECENIIDFPRSDATTQIYSNYKDARTSEINEGANHYTALECWNNDNASTRFTQSENATGARRYIKLSANVEMEILYNHYYENSAAKTEGEENEYSVCIMINQYGENYDFANLNNPENEKNVNHFLFTGDLEADGENYLVQNNDLPEVVLFKGGHHGSYTATSDVLLNAIKPKVVCICCCTGTDEFGAKPENTFPAQAMLNRVAKHTDLVFATSLFNSSISKGELPNSLNGNIVITANHLGVNLTASNNVTLIKDTQWFKDNRICPAEWQ